MPTGLLMPVASMSIRLRIGGTQMFDSPGHLHRAVELLDQLRRSSCPGRHSSCGLNWIVVSIISIGAGSVAVSARPDLAEHARDLGHRLDHAVGLLQELAGLGRRQSRQRGRHVEEIALVHRRHELAAELQHRPRGRRQRERGDARASPSASASAARSSGR